MEPISRPRPLSSRGDRNGGVLARWRRADDGTRGDRAPARPDTIRRRGDRGAASTAPPWAGTRPGPVRRPRRRVSPNWSAATARMVLRACCRGILREEHAAHDALQVTFSSWPGRRGNSGFATRSAPSCTASPAGSPATLAAEARRQARQRTAAGFTDRPPVADGRLADNADLVAVLHEEIGRLTASHRAVAVLCDLEGHTHEQAQQLGARWGRSVKQAS